MLSGLASNLNAGDRRLTIQEAEELARTALSIEAKRLPGVSLEPSKNPHRHVTFDVLWANPGSGSVHSQFLTVDLETGEVWAPISCIRITTAELRTAQVSIRKRLHISDHDVKKVIQDQSGCALE